MCGCEHKPLELKIKQGESIGFAFTLTQQGSPVDLTNSTMLMQVRENVEDNGTYLITKTITTASDPDGQGIIVNPTAGQFMFKVNSEDIDDMSTTKPYFVAIYHINGDIKDCISANNHQVAKFLVLNP
jgi:hypothetical protein